MKNLLFLFIGCFVYLSNANAQKLKQPFKYLPTCEDLRKDSFPDLVSFIKVGKLDNNFVIEATDKSFKLEPNTQFVPKSYTNGYVDPTDKDIKKRFKNSKGIKVKIKYDYEIDNPEYNPRDSIGKLQPKKIREKGDLYGLIEFNKVWDECADLPNTRAYNISITREQIERAKGGNISVIYEYYKCKVPFQDEKPKEHTYTSFVLWLSDIEF